MADAKLWIEEIKGLGLDQRGELFNALETLESWEFFKKEYGWTRIFDIKWFIEESLKNTEATSGGHTADSLEDLADGMIGDRQ
jgi:hypothetical protein